MPVRLVGSSPTEGSMAHSRKILLFHRVVADDTPEWMLDALSGEVVTQSMLRIQLEWVGKRNRFVDLETLLDTLLQAA